MFLTIYIKNSTLPSLKIIVYTLIDVWNETLKHYFAIIAFRCECSSPFQGTTASRCPGTVWKIFTVTNAPFTSKLESNGLQIHRNRKFSQRSFSTPAIFKAASSFSAHRAVLMTKTDLIFPIFPLTLVDFAVQLCFHEKRCSSQLWQWRDFPGQSIFHDLCSYHILTSSGIYHWADARQLEPVC